MKIKEIKAKSILSPSKIYDYVINQFSEDMIRGDNMGLNITTRNETDSDIEEISKVTIEAFRALAISQHTEQFIINALRKANALTISLVAEIDGQVTGHIAFSPLTISNGSLNWYGLEPISVLPKYQKQGIGKTLIHKGLSLLNDLGAHGCALVGDPQYYQRFGFRNIPGLIHEGIPQEVFLALPFDKKIPQGTVTFHEGFWAKS